ncbi:MAG: malto-oligosyltrehalose synthase [Elainellaceae cyanobacterium]
MRIPVATYRIQFNPDFGFSDAQTIVTYLSELGISDLYASPIFKARTGSTHGYDVIDPRQLNPELGTRAEFDDLVRSLHRADMGWLQDIVPNHMAYSTQNEFLLDVLEYGPDSDYFNMFDIEWEHPYHDIQGKVLTPMLGDFYGKCLENGQLTLKYDETGLSINYYELSLPLRIESYAQLILHDLGRLRRSLEREHPDFIKLLGILYVLKSAIAETSGRQRRDQATFVKSLLWELYQSNDEIKAFIDRNIEIFNGTVGDPSSFDLLDAMLSNQYFRLAFWKVGAEELNYRRFFTVNDLICLSIDDPKVFKLTHSLIHELVESGAFNGVRIDHIDGLYNPKQYLQRLRDQVGDAYITVEKILEPGEELPNDWPIQGTSGYDGLNTINGIFCQPQSEDIFNRIYHNFRGDYRPYYELEIDCKRLIADTNLAGDVENLANLLKQIAGRYRYASDFTLNGLRRAILEVLVLFPIYRTYITSEGVSERDRAYVDKVIASAKHNAPQLVNELDFIKKLLLFDHEDWLNDAEKNQWMYFVMRMQQFSGPLMAKGIEDTLFYIYYRLLSLNEVGGAPHQFGSSPDEFHASNRYQVEHWIHSMNALSTHDTKRSEDVRARLNVLSEIPDEWEVEVETWRAINQSYRVHDGDRLIPDANDEYFLYQTLVGVFPFESFDYQTFVDRITSYVVKAVREAKVHTAWLQPDTTYENGFVTFVEKLLDPRGDNDFLARLRTFQARIAFYGMCNSLSQTLLKITIPGVPDTYQGTEFWDLSLVDPDNRRPVDYDARLKALRTLKHQSQSDIASLLDDLKQHATSGHIKMFTIARALAARHEHLDLFQQGTYIPIRAVGQFQDNIVAFARQKGYQVALTVIPRFLTSMVEPGTFPVGEAVWADTHLEIPKAIRGNWINAMTDESLPDEPQLPIAKILKSFPVALLVRQ